MLVVDVVGRCKLLITLDKDNARLLNVTLHFWKTPCVDALADPANADRSEHALTLRYEYNPSESWGLVRDVTPARNDEVRKLYTGLWSNADPLVRSFAQLRSDVC